MMEDSHNLFVSLGRWASRQGENFLTEALVVTLRHLIKNEPDVAVRILAELTGGFLLVEADAASDVSLNTRTATGLRTATTTGDG